MEGEWRGEGSHESGAGGDDGGQERHHAVLTDADSDAIASLRGMMCGPKQRGAECEWADGYKTRPRPLRYMGNIEYDCGGDRVICRGGGVTARVAAIGQD